MTWFLRSYVWGEGVVKARFAAYGRFSMGIAKSLSTWVSRALGRPKEIETPRGESRDYSLSELRSFTGQSPEVPILIALRGVVYDVSEGRSFYGKDGPYGMFAGRDCTRALAKMSFEEADFVGDESGLDRDELDQLQEWVETIEGKYHRLGALIE